MQPNSNASPDDPRAGEEREEVTKREKGEKERRS
jgi:hypothetical protein